MVIKNNKQLQGNISNILLIQLGDIGDVVLSIPSIRALRERFPHANIIVAVREKAKELIQDCRWADGVIAIHKAKRRLIEEIQYQKDFFLRLRQFHFDLAIDMRDGDRGAILAFLSGAPHRIAYYADDGKLWRNRVFTKLILPQNRPDEHMAERYYYLLAANNIGTEFVWPEITIPFEKKQKAIDLFREENIPSDLPVIALQPFSLWQYKEWGIEKYAQLINWIGSTYKFPVIITGAPDERKRVDEIIKQCGDNACNFAGKTSIGLLPAVLKMCGLFIGVDSAGIHISAAVGTPTISIFGPGVSAAWAPRGSQHAIVIKNFPCVPCRLKGCQDTEISRCLEELTTEEVIEVVRKQIQLLFGDYLRKKYFPKHTG